MSALRNYLVTLEQLPAGTLAPVAGLVAEIRLRLEDDGGLAITSSDNPPVDPAAAVLTWRERLWIVPPETRLGAVEVAEAFGRPRSWVYRRTGPACEHTPLPCRKLDGELVFVAGELRSWIAAHEAVVSAPPAPSATPVVPLRSAAGSGSAGRAGSGSARQGAA